MIERDALNETTSDERNYQLQREKVEEIKSMTSSQANTHGRSNSGVHKQQKNKDGQSTIGFEHDNWNLMLHMIFGVSKSVRNSY